MLSQERVFQLGIESPGTQLWIVLHTVLRALHRHGTYPGGLALVHQGILLQSLSPPLDALVKRFLVLNAPLQGAELSAPFQK